MTFDPSFEDDQVIIPGAVPPQPLGLVTFNPDFSYGQPTDVDLMVAVNNTNFDVALFRSMFPPFASVTAYPDAALIGTYDFATAYIDDTPQCGISGLTAMRQTQALQLMTAHLLTINNRIDTYGINSGRGAGFVKSSSVKDVSYTLEVPKAASAFGQWLNLTPYGQQLRALLSVASVGGLYIGGTPAQAGFRPGAIPGYGFRRF